MVIKIDFLVFDQFIDRHHISYLEIEHKNSNKGNNRKKFKKYVPLKQKLWNPSYFPPKEESAIHSLNKRLTLQVRVPPLRVLASHFSVQR